MSTFHVSAMLTLNVTFDKFTSIIDNITEGLILATKAQGANPTDTVSSKVQIGITHQDGLLYRLEARHSTWFWGSRASTTQSMVPGYDMISVNGVWLDHLSDYVNVFNGRHYSEMVTPLALNLFDRVFRDFLTVSTGTKNSVILTVQQQANQLVSSVELPTPPILFETLSQAHANYELRITL